MKRSSGTLLYRKTADGLEVLLVHPSGVYNRNAAWSIPKGTIDGEELPEQAARRKTREETGVEAGELMDLGYIDYTRSRKRIFCYAGPAPADAAPFCASWEVDQACFVSIDRAREILHHDQVAFLDRLLEQLQGASPSS